MPFFNLEKIVREKHYFAMEMPGKCRGILNRLKCGNPEDTFCRFFLPKERGQFCLLKLSSTSCEQWMWATIIKVGYMNSEFQMQRPVRRHC